MPERFDIVARIHATPEIIYICADGSIGLTPDCIGFYWYDSIEEAREDFPDAPIRHIGFVWED